MKIYKNESALKDLIKSQAKTCLIASLGPIKDSDKINKILTKAKNIKAFADMSCPGFLYGSAILASTVMNKNDDVFLPDETWKARLTPENTPFNNEHEEKNIIGHIVSSCVLDENGNEYTGDDAPEYFDIGVDFVVYKEIFPDVASSIEQLGPEEKLFVSMEAIMSNFDYALVDNSSNIKIIQRNDQTSFLTQALRIFGGTGKYGDYRVGRVLRDFRFSGMANVDSPANPRSIYTSMSNDTDILKEKISQASRNVFNKFDNFIFTTKGNVMVIENLDQAKTVIADLEAKVTASDIVVVSLKEAKTQLEIVTASLNTEKETVKAKELEIKTLSEDKQSISAKLELAIKSCTDLQTKVEATEKLLEEKTKSADYMQTKLDDYKKASTKSDRAKKLKDMGYDITDEDASNYASMSDDAFNDIVSFADKFKKKDAKDDGTSKDDKEKDKKDSEKDADAILKDAKADTETKAPENIETVVVSREEELKTIATELMSKMFENRKSKSKSNKKQ